MTTAITSDDVLGRLALDPDGDILGVVTKLHLDAVGRNTLGITIDQGLLKPDLYVGIEHVKRFGVDAVLLKTIPYENLKGLPVIGIHGTPLGTVSKVIVEESVLKGLTVKRRKGMFGSESFDVTASDVKELGQNVILRRKATKEAKEAIEEPEKTAAKE
jgi:sporulation protein YlmC with PRC-barrel domain